MEGIEEKIDMGNHAVGDTIGPQAEEALRNRKTGESALDILDRICNPWRGTDAEFESRDPANPSNVHPDLGSPRFQCNK